MADGTENAQYFVCIFLGVLAKGPGSPSARLSSAHSNLSCKVTVIGFLKSLPGCFMPYNRVRTCSLIHRPSRELELAADHGGSSDRALGRMVMRLFSSGVHWTEEPLCPVHRFLKAMTWKARIYGLEALRQEPHPIQS